MNDEVIWEEPPEEVIERARLGTKGPYLDWALELKANPGTWARAPREYKSESSAKNAAMNMRAGNVKGMPKGEFEVVSDGTKLWARYREKDSKGDADPDRGIPGDDTLRRDYARRVRAWAKENDVEIADHGRIPKDVVEHYIAATGDEQPSGANGLKAVR